MRGADLEAAAVPAVDVIVPCYNYGRFLHECVTSALSQTGVAVNVLILDDASQDGTENVASALTKSDPRVTYRRHPFNQGHISTYNEGIAWLTAPYYLLLSADDCLAPGALMRAARVLNDNPNVGFVFGEAVDVVGDMAPWLANHENVPLEYQVMTGLAFADRSGARNIVRTPTAVVRTALQQQVGGYRHDLPHAGDMEMWLRLAAISDVAMIRNRQAFYRVHGMNMSAEYCTKRLIEDIEQRQACLASFFESPIMASIPRSRRRRARAMRLLSRDALSLATSVAGSGRSRETWMLIAAAHRLSPAALFTSQMVKVVAKECTGERRWRWLRSAAGRA